MPKEVQAEPVEPEQNEVRKMPERAEERKERPEEIEARVARSKAETHDFIMEACGLPSLKETLRSVQEGVLPKELPIPRFITILRPPDRRSHFALENGIAGQQIPTPPTELNEPVPAMPREEEESGKLSCPRPSDRRDKGAR